MKSVDYVKTQLNKRKEPYIYELVECAQKYLNLQPLIDKYSKQAVVRKVVKAVKAGYFTDDGTGCFEMTDKAKEFFTKEQV